MRKLIFFFLSFILAESGVANNVTLDSLVLTDSLNLSLRVTWDNSWNLPDEAPLNYDAAWIFLKYKQGGQWKHLNLSDVSADHNVTDTTAEIIAVTDSKGVYVKRRSKGEGVLTTNIHLRLNNYLTPGSYDIRAFAIEMVYIPEGSFFLGDSVSNNTFRNAATGGPFKVSSESTIIVGNSGNVLDNTITSPPASNIPSVYPKGYQGFYMMKYEISQEQYVDFLNTLNFTQQGARTAKWPTSVAGTYVMGPVSQQSNRNAIMIKTQGSSSVPAVYGVDADGDQVSGEVNDGGARACNFLSWQDLTAYLDWSCLRPMTEFEFEKSARGTCYPKPLEFAWGTTNVIDANTMMNDGDETESVTEKGDSITGVASHGYAGPQGPVRCGFNGSLSCNRNESGSGYYGVKELSGNLWEQCVSVSAVGLTYLGLNGDGSLSTTGGSDEGWWNTSGDGVAIRGGGWNSGVQPGFRDLAVSDRFYGFFNTSTRRNTTGGRGCRTF